MIKKIILQFKNNLERNYGLKMQVFNLKTYHLDIGKTYQLFLIIYL